ncbi:hypothetical protein BU16DRAFT_541808 [Lophium mytilinum]|uniref:Uncharacterized protein n=1 Tax=Lophium mytilinum TaxID=390894 RepID=A0A6A6QLQ8_9PEZI|nr:hypothetical protein BU16DRAFT_541808 [Lophium mytilinum]
MCGPKTHYYCCQCGDGPQSITLQPVCINCEHKGCNVCSSDGSEHVHAEDDPLLPSCVGQVLVNAFDSHDHNFPLMPSPRPAIPIVDAIATGMRAVHLDFLDHHSSSTGYLLAYTRGNDSIPSGDPTDGDTDWVWYCCHCGDGGLGPVTTGCPMCGIPKCDKCVIEYVKR